VCYCLCADGPKRVYSDIHKKKSLQQCVTVSSLRMSWMYKLCKSWIYKHVGVTISNAATHWLPKSRMFLLYWRPYHGEGKGHSLVMGHLHVPWEVYRVTICTPYATKIKCQKFSKSQTGSEVSAQLMPQFQSFIISLYLSVCSFSLPSINYNYLCQTSIEKRHKYVCLIWRKTWTNVDDFSKPCQ
jgi:hypothetical protein